MEKKSKKRLFIILGIVIGLIILGVILLIFFSSQTEIQSTTATIHFPTHGAAVTLGDPLEVQSSARNDGELITAIELWHVKAGVFTLVDKTILEVGDHIISLSHGWLPSSLGSQKLMVRAFTESGGIGEAAVEVTVDEPEEERATLEGSEGGFSLPEGGFGEFPSGGGLSEDDFDPLPNLEEAVDPDWILGSALLPLVLDGLMPAIEFVDVEIEALSFEVGEIYSGVYCYVALEAYPPARAPDTGYFDTSDQVHWNIAEHLGGSNAVTIPVINEQPLDILLECEGVKDNGGTVSLGQLDAAHPPQDWNGQIFQAFGSGGEGFTITYRINPVISELVAPTQLHAVEVNQQSYFHWLWQGIVGEIDSFRIYRDEVLVANLPADALLYPVPQTWMEPLCGEEYVYHVTAYRGSEESAPSNPLLFQGAACDYGNDILQLSPTSTGSACDGITEKFKVRYLHGFPPGKATISLQVFKDGEMLPDFHSTHPNILHVTGTALVQLVYMGTEPVTSDQIAVTMVNKQGQVFYDEFFDRTMDWTPGTLDLAISNVTISKSGTDLYQNILRARVKNLGCALAMPSDLVVVREADGWSGFLNVPQIGPKSSEIVALGLLPNDAEKWRGEIELKVDPLDNIVESNENNNEYRIGTARVESIQFYKVDIHNDHDKAPKGKGEWTLYFDVGRFRAGIQELPQESKDKDNSWGEGFHNLSTSFDLNLAADDSLLIIVSGRESDYHGPVRSSYNDCRNIGNVVVYFSPDGSPNSGVESLETQVCLDFEHFTHLGSWKSGGEYYLLSDKEDFTIYFRLVLDR